MKRNWKSFVITCSVASSLLVSMSASVSPAYAAANAKSSSVQVAAAKKISIFKRVNSNSQTVGIADKLMRDELYVNTIWPTYKFNGKLTWKENPYKDDSWSFYFQSLDMVGYLTNAYEQTHSQKYLEKAQWYIESWMNANPSPTKQASRFAWKDHSTANRVVTMIQFWEQYKNSAIYDKDFENKLIEMLEKHGDFLMDDKNYSAGSNHGIFQDRSLIELALIFPDMSHSEQWYKKGMGRLITHVEGDVTKSGVHKEHSPSYHLLVLNLFKSINGFIKQFNVNEPKLKDGISKMEDYLAFVGNQSGDLPMLGDSQPESLYSLNPKSITSQKLLYVVTKGKQGKKPGQEMVYADGGTAVFKNDLNNERPLYLLFTSAFHSTTHKHADDLSFILNYGKTDFFVDSGKYNYSYTDPYREYFKGTLAHNTVTVDKKSFPVTKDQVNKSKISSSEINKTYSYVTGSHELYKGVKVSRTLVYLKNTNSILVRDVMESNKNHTYTDIFNIGKDVDVKKSASRVFTLTSKLDQQQIELIQLTKMSTIKNYKGSASPIAGWQSLEFNKKLPITQLQFTNSNQKNAEYKFIINTNTNNGVQNYTVKSTPSADIYTIVLKNGKRTNVQVKK
ncbi:alginate lyase family protein [Priestia megaterium]|uniref:alginate lyase family protein n=1 Tax=Priestia megaterium TaxID=1404 RepID=UPI002B2523A8|nr:heparinase II/III family protein [Priestia megaterium]MEB2289935.1 heparinase II/III family protein [Priestia megaterium]MEE3892734.1 heparinase II/III family protein [Priestia megaterium]